MTRLPENHRSGSKYHSVKTEVDGIVFHSRREGERYKELKLLQTAGKIRGLELQVRFLVIPPYREERGAKYIADFVYVEDGVKVVEDVKSDPTKTTEYVLKRKLFKLRYPEYEFRETY